MIGLVRMNRGRWIVDCPNVECAWSYEAIAPSGAPRYLWRCTGERWKGPHAAGCGTMVELVWPAPDEAEQIMEALRHRNVIATRNWEPYETVDMLLAENERFLVGCDLKFLADHGIGVPR